MKFLKIALRKSTYYFWGFNARTARELDHLEDQGANNHITEDIF